MRLKIINGLVLFLALILTISSITFYSYFKNNLFIGIEEHLSHWAHLLLVDIAKSPEEFHKTPETFIRSPRNVSYIFSETHVQFRDARGILIARSQRLLSELPFEKGEDDLFRDFELSNHTKLKVYQRRIFSQGKGVGYVIVGMSIRQVQHYLNNFRNLLMVVTVCTLLILAYGINLLISVDIVQKQKLFLSFASHELRIPLTVISGQAEVALRKNQSPQKYRKVLQVIKTESEEMRRTIQYLLSLFRSRAGVDKLQKISFNLGELILEEAQSLKQRYPLKNVVVKLSARSQIKADPQQIKNLVQNLLENAAKYTAAKGRIKIQVTSLPDHLELTISDNGKGIPKELQKKIFDSYYRIEKDEEKGMGLGLAIVKWVVEAHKGAIQVKSSLGKGTHFMVSLPVS